MAGRRPGDPRTGTFRLLRRPCATCVAFADDRAHLGQRRRVAFLAGAVAKDRYVICHETLVGRRQAAICRGFFNLHGADVWPLRLMVALGLIRQVAPPRERGGDVS